MLATEYFTDEFVLCALTGCQCIEPLRYTGIIGKSQDARMDRVNGDTHVPMITQECGRSQGLP